MTSVVRIHPLPPEERVIVLITLFLFYKKPFVGGFEPHTINATACVASELSRPPSSTGKKINRFDYPFLHYKKIFIAILITYYSPLILKS